MPVLKERGKWLIALALCLSCLVLCATLISAPTLAVEEPPAEYKAVTGFDKYVFEHLNAGASKSPEEFVYASSATPAQASQVYNIALKKDAGAYLVGIDVQIDSSKPADIQYFPVKKDATLDTKVVPAPTEAPALTDPVLKKIDGRANLYEVFFSDGTTPFAPPLYVYASSAAAPAAQDDELLPVYKVADKGGDKAKDKYYVKLANDIYVAVAKDGTLDCNDVVKKLGATNEEVLFPKPPPPPPVYKYKPVDGYKKLFEVLGADGKSKVPPEYLYSATAPVDGSAPPAGALVAHLNTKNNYFYVPLVEGSGIFLAVNTDDTLNYSNVIWWGLDEKFGTIDDLATSIREENGYYYWRQAEGVWRMIQGIFNPNFTTTTTTTTTTAPETSSTTPVDPSSSTTEPETSSTTNGYLTSSENQGQYPKTGLPFNPGVAVCMALLLMGCVYCGIQVFRRRTVKAR